MEALNGAGHCTVRGYDCALGGYVNSLGTGKGAIIGSDGGGRTGAYCATRGRKVTGSGCCVGKASASTSSAMIGVGMLWSNSEYATASQRCCVS
jgi:hypothetical protein